MDSVFKKYNATDKAGFEKQTESDLILIRKQTYNWAYGMLGGIVAILIPLVADQKPERIYIRLLYIMSILSALILLIVGLTTTMIQIDARIQEMDFYLAWAKYYIQKPGAFFSKQKHSGRR